MVYIEVVGIPNEFANGIVPSISRSRYLQCSILSIRLKFYAVLFITTRGALYTVLHLPTVVRLLAQMSRSAASVGAARRALDTRRSSR